MTPPARPSTRSGGCSACHTPVGRRSWRRRPRRRGTTWSSPGLAWGHVRLQFQWAQDRGTANHCDGDRRPRDGFGESALTADRSRSWRMDSRSPWSTCSSQRPASRPPDRGEVRGPGRWRGRRTGSSAIAWPPALAGRHPSRGARPALCTDNGAMIGAAEPGAGQPVPGPASIWMLGRRCRWLAGERIAGPGGSG